MVLYRRFRVAGGTCFFTVNLRNPAATTLVDRVDLLRAAFAATIKKRPFVINAIVIMPNHLHAIWTLPDGDHGYSSRWSSIKTRFARSLVKNGHPLLRNARGEYLLWQRRFWEHTITTERDFTNHVNYIHYNPVKHGFVLKPIDWPHSSFHRYVAAGLYPPDWASPPPDPLCHPDQKISPGTAG